MSTVTAAQEGLVSCETCRLLLRPVHPAHPAIARAAVPSWNSAAPVRSSTPGRW